MSSLKDQIINKVDNIYDTKQAIKRAIEDKGQTIEDDLSFYSYADKIRQITAMDGVVKLFETEEEMQADSTAKEGDLAVVYKNNLHNMISSEQVKVLSFPESVTLSSAVTDGVGCSLVSSDGSIIAVYLYESYFSFDSNMGRGFDIRYESSDGIHFIRNSFSYNSNNLSNPVYLDESYSVKNQENWDDRFGYFIQVTDIDFGGLYKYSGYSDDNYLDFPYRFSLSGETINCEYSSPLYIKDIQETLYNIVEQELGEGLYDLNIHFKDFGLDGNPTKCTIIQGIGNGVTIRYCSDDNKFYLSEHSTHTSSYTKQLTLIEVDLVNKQSLGKSTKSYTTTEYPSGTSSMNYAYNFEEIVYDDIYASLRLYVGGTSWKYSWIAYYISAKYNTNIFSSDFRARYSTLYKYQIAPSQLTITSSNQLLPDVKAYGKNGNITGDGSIYNSLNLDELFAANGMHIYKDSLVALKESSTGNKIKDVEPFTDGVGFITSNNTIGELFKNYQVIRSKSYIITYDDTTINLYDLNYNLLQTGTNSRIKDLFLKSKLIYEDDDKVVHIGFSNNSYDGYCFLVDLSEDAIKITYVSLDFERIDLICYVGEDKEHNGYKYYVVSRNSYSSSSVRIEAFTTTESGVGYTKTISNVSLTGKTRDDTSYCCFDDNYVYMTLPPYWRKFIVIDKSTDTIIKNDTSESSIYLCNNVSTCYMNTGGDTNSGVYKLNGTSQEKMSENKNIPTISTGLYQYYYISDYDCIVADLSSGNEVVLSTSQEQNKICNFRMLLQPYYNGGMNNGSLNTTLYLNGTKLEGLAIVHNNITHTDGNVFNISVDFTKTLSNEGNINTLPINNGYIGNLVISQMNNTNYNNTLTPEEYLQALQTAKEIKGNKINGVVINE